MEQDNETQIHQNSSHQDARRYMWKMLQSRKLGLSIGGVLSLMYLFCCIMLSISTYALLFGSLLLFFSLAVMIYASLKLKKRVMATLQCFICAQADVYEIALREIQLFCKCSHWIWLIFHN